MTNHQWSYLIVKSFAGNWTWPEKLLFTSRGCVFMASQASSTEEGKRKMDYHFLGVTRVKWTRTGKIASDWRFRILFDETSTIDGIRMERMGFFLRWFHVNFNSHMIDFVILMSDLFIVSFILLVLILITFRCRRTTISRCRSATRLCWRRWTKAFGCSNTRCSACAFTTSPCPDPAALRSDPTPTPTHDSNDPHRPTDPSRWDA